jgi:predicted glycoside hydrolase/deacetylase ChbG (UPF0249 family)
MLLGSPCTAPSAPGLVGVNKELSRRRKLKHPNEEKGSEFQVTVSFSAVTHRIDDTSRQVTLSVGTAMHHTIEPSPRLASGERRLVREMEVSQRAEREKWRDFRRELSNVSRHSSNSSDQQTNHMSLRPSCTAPLAPGMVWCEAKPLSWRWKLNRPNIKKCVVFTWPLTFSR